MKKIVSLLLVFGCAFLLSSSLFAATEFTAEVSFTSGGEVSFDAVLKNRTGNTSATAITWNASDITIGTSDVQWKASTVYAVLTSTITKAVGKVYLYQNNKSTTTAAKYQATNPRHETTNQIYSGLVKANSAGGDGNFAPMTFLVSTVTVTTPDISPVISEYGKRYFIDQDNSNFAKSGYCTVVDADGYINAVDGSGNVQHLAKQTTGYMYFGAGFQNVLAGTSYGTNNIKFEIVTE